MSNKTVTVLGAITFAIAVGVCATYFSRDVRAADAKQPFPVLYVSNFNTDEITAYDARNGSFLGVLVKSRGELRGANGLAVGPDGDIYLAGQFSNNVVRYDGRTGAFKAVVDPDNQAGVSAPQGLNFGPDGLLYAASYNNDKVVTYNTTTNRFASQFAEVKSAAVKHMGPQDPFFGSDGNMYLGNFDGDSTLKYKGPNQPNQPAGAASTMRPGTLITTFEKPLQRAAVSAGAFASGVSALARVSNPNPTAAPAAGQAAGQAAAGQSFVYIDHIDPKSFTGEVLQYTTDGKFVKTFVPNQTGGLVLTGGIDVGPDGNLYVANVKVNHQFQDVGSTIMRFDINTGKYIGVFVPNGKRLDVPFAMCFAKRSTQIPRATK